MLLSRYHLAPRGKGGPVLALAHLYVTDNTVLQRIRCSSTHISHIIMCWNSTEWVVSLVSHLKLEKTCWGRQQLLPPRHRCLHSAVNWSLGNSGAATEGGWFLPSFHLPTSLSCLIGCLSTGFVADAGVEGNCTGCGECSQMPGKRSESERQLRKPSFTVSSQSVQFVHVMLTASVTSWGTVNEPLRTFPGSS